MNTMDRETLAEWLDLDLDGQLGRSERAQLEEQLGADPKLAAEHRRLESLHVMLTESRIPVRPDFREQVMAQLPSPVWQASRVPVWALPAAMMVVLGVASALVLGMGAPAAEGALLGTGLAVFDFLKATMVAGAGLMAASWRGFGWGLEELIASSGLSLVAMAVLVVFMNLLFISMMRRRSGEVALEHAGSEGVESRSS